MNLEINDRALEARLQKLCSACSKRRKNRIAGCWKTKPRSTPGSGVASNSLTGARVFLKTNWTLTSSSSKPSLDEGSLRSCARDLDLVRIWRYIKNNTSVEMADRVESVIREKISYLAARPGAGRWREDLTDEPVKFFSIYAYLIVLPTREDPRAGCGHSPWPPRRGATSQGSLMRPLIYLTQPTRPR